MRLINVGRILDNSKTLSESLVLIRDIIMPELFDLCGLSFTDKHYHLLYTKKSEMNLLISIYKICHRPWTEILSSLSR